MISLNLNSPYQKKEIKFDRFYHLLKNSFGLIGVILIISSIILLIARNTLENNFNSIVAETSLVQQQIRGSNQKISDVNRQLKSFYSTQKDFIPWSNVMVYLTKLVPSNIKINLFTINPADVKNSEQWTISIKGTAKTRDDFLAFQDKLKKSTLFDKVETPIDNITQKENIDFEFKIFIASNKIRLSSQ